MWRLLLRPIVAWSLAAILIVTMTGFTVLQWFLLDETGAAQAAQAGARLEQAAQGFAEDFDREMIRALICFTPRPSGRGEQVAALWQRTAPYPGLIAEVSSLDAGARRFPRPQLLLDARSLPQDHPLGLLPPLLIIPDPRSFSRLPRRRSERREEFSEGGPSWVHVRLDPDVLRDVFEELTDRHFSFGGALDYHVEVREQEEVVFRMGPELLVEPASSGEGDARVELFGRTDPVILRGLVGEIGAELEPEARRRLFESLEPPGPEAGPPGRERWRIGGGLGALFGGSRWKIELVVTHPEGSLANALSRVRRRNLAISCAILALFAGALGLLILTARRAQQLAAQQLDFVAGVTHELLTPLAAMRSAGQNLADGVVRDEAKVRRYGALVEREGRRLSDLVSQVLDFAGIQSGRRVYASDRVDLTVAIRSVLDAWRALLDEAGFEVEEELPGEPLYFVGDAAAFERALGNLIGNALKYAADGRRLRGRGAGRRRDRADRRERPRPRHRSTRFAASL